MVIGDSRQQPEASSPEQPPPPEKLLSGIYNSRVFLMRCPSSSRGHDLRELVQTQLQISCPILQLRVLSLQQGDETFPRERDAATAHGEEISYTTKVERLFVGMDEVEGGEGRVQFRVERGSNKHIAAVGKTPSPLLSCDGMKGLLLSKKRVRAEDLGEANELWESAEITAKDVDDLKRLVTKLQRVVKDEKPARCQSPLDSKDGLKKTQMCIVKEVARHPEAWPFRQPVDTSVVKDYLVFVKEPVDLSLIKKRVQHGSYPSVSELKDDLIKMCANCMTYNRPGTTFHRCGMELLKYIEDQL